ncbi:prepilin peptidase [Streptomyces castrisilvae]|uniref:Prepilin peptidase n=2 Tax=Streptomyces castrisilvae TaxID=3033811 RepID=A0ABY9HPQ2_9ACTN|nr:prepilin peptidase [Streptomyces sp. Mut1]WLQ35983.1 prepilin peptidase [Streptomyces sp. Mut1]
MYAMLMGVAALWGAATGLLVPRAAYRFSVRPGEPRRDACPAGHPLTGPARAWLGTTRCATCAGAPVAGVQPVAEATEPGPVPLAGAAGPGRPVPPAGAAEPEPGPVPPADTADAADAADDRPAGPLPVEPPPTGLRYAPYRLAPVVTALVCAALAWSTGTRPELAVWLVLAPIGVLLASVDHRVHRLPDGLTLPAAGAAAVLLGLAALLPEHAGSWLSALLGGLVLGAFYFLLFLINPSGMGFGDVKLALSLGVALGWYGWAVVFAGGFAGFLFGAVYGVVLVVLRRAGRRTGIPFGPFMLAGALLGLLFGGLAV